MAYDSEHDEWMNSPEPIEHDTDACEECQMSDTSGTLADTEDYVKALFYGPKGRRKTSYMAGAARLCGPKQRILAIDTEGKGWLKFPLKRLGIPLDRIMYRTATCYNDMEANFWEVEPKVKSGEVIAVFVDHMSDLEQRFIRAATMARQLRKAGLGPVKNFRKASDLIAKGVNPFQTELGDYGVWTNQARHLMRLYRDLPCHVGFAAHTRTEEGQWVPGLTEKFREELMGSLNLIVGCDLVSFGDEDSDIYGVGVCREIGMWRGADRIGFTRPKTVNPSMDRLVQALAGDLDFTTDPEQLAFKERLTARTSG